MLKTSHYPSHSLPLLLQPIVLCVCVFVMCVWLCVCLSLPCVYNLWGTKEGFKSHSFKGSALSVLTSMGDKMLMSMSAVCRLAWLRGNFLRHKQMFVCKLRSHVGLQMSSGTKGKRAVEHFLITDLWVHLIWLTGLPTVLRHSIL